MGVSATVSCVTLNCQTLPASQWTFDQATELLKVTQLESITASGAWASSWTLTWS
jgi:hypothetical protein